MKIVVHSIWTIFMSFALFWGAASAHVQEAPQENSAESSPENSQAKDESPDLHQANNPAPFVEAPLPELPPPPTLKQVDYPDCREDHQQIDAPYDKAEDINRCTQLLDRYYSDILNAFRVRMNAHQDEISQIYTEKVAGNEDYLPKTSEAFYAKMMKEHAASNADGDNMAAYRAAEALYQMDRNYLRDRFCYNTGCAGYPVPKNPAGSSKSAKKKSDKNSKKRTASSGKGKKCKKSRRRGQLLGGVFGGLFGKKAGLGKIGTVLASGFGAVLVGELACKLSEKEQEQAAAATEEVTKVEEVGATVEWKSPERKGVSGSSTVTAINSQPNGTRCMNITDVAIIDGEETRISKQMCRGTGDAGYTIMA